MGSPLDSVGSIVAVTALSERVWAVASAEGLVSAVAWEEESFKGPIWSVPVGLPVRALHSAGATLVVEGSDRLVGLSSVDGSSRWEVSLSLAGGETGTVNGHVFLSTESALRVFETEGGTLLTELAVESKPVGAAVVDDGVLWLDVSGAAHRAPLGGEGGRESTPLGGPLSRASFEGGAFLFTTDAGEIGLVEIATPGDAILSQRP
jgi:hypothetical protein